MIDACRTRVEGSDRVTYRLGDFRTEVFGDDCHVVVASLSLHHLERSERPSFFERVYRSLAPGGHFIAADVIVDESPEVRVRQYELWRRYMVDHGEDGDSWYRKHLAKDHPLEVSTLIRMLSEAGLVSPGCFWRYLNFAIVSASR